MHVVLGRCALCRSVSSGGSCRFFRHSPAVGQQEAQVDVHGDHVAAVPSPRRSGQEAAFRKGTGGRMSFSGNVVTIFGATGFSGKFVMNRLARDGTQMIIPYRLDPYYMRQYKVYGDLGQILFFPFHLEDEDSIRKALKHSNIVVNLIGRDHETPNFSFHKVHMEGARRLARLAKEMGVKRFIHCSAMNASLAPKEFFIPGGSEFLRTKAAGEDAVREEFPEAVIIRPADMYGINDKFLRFYGHWFRKYLFWRIDVHRKGVETYKMPLYVNDLAAGIHKIVQDPTLDGLTVECVGPECYQLADLIDYFYRRIGKGDYTTYRRTNGYSPIFKLYTNLLELKTWLRRSQPVYNWEILERIECHSDILTGVPTLEDIGVKNLSIFPLASREWVDMFSRIGFMEIRYGEYPEPPEPTPLPPLTLREPTREVHVTETKTYTTDPNWYKGNPLKRKVQGI